MYHIDTCMIIVTRCQRTLWGWRP